MNRMYINSHENAFFIFRRFVLYASMPFIMTCKGAFFPACFARLTIFVMLLFASVLTAFLKIPFLRFCYMSPQCFPFRLLLVCMYAGKFECIV